MGRKLRKEEKKEGPTSLFILTESNPIRRLTVFLIEWPPFEYTVLLTIIANCVVLAIERPQPNGDKTELARRLVSTLERKKLNTVAISSWLFFYLMKVEIILTFWMQFWVLSWVINLPSWIYEAGFLFLLSGRDFRINLTLQWVMTNVNFVIIGNLLSDIRFRLGIWMKAVTSSLNWLNFREHKTAPIYSSTM